MIKTIIQIDNATHTFTFGQDSVEYQCTVDDRKHTPGKCTFAEAIETIKDFAEVQAQLAAKR